MILAGLDIETTGLHVNAGHRLIQIGFAGPKGNMVFDVCPDGSMAIDQEALDINHFTIQRIAEGIPRAEVDAEMALNLRSDGYTEESITPVGWNVGGFDLVFILRELPETAKFFSRRTLDLTGVAMMHELRTGKSYRELKAEMAQTIAERLGRDARHDALYDAEAALVAVELFKEMQ